MGGDGGCGDGQVMIMEILLMTVSNENDDGNENDDRMVKIKGG